MNVEFVNPFLDAILNVLSTMATIEAKRGKPFLKRDKQARGEITGLIGLAGNQVKGSVAINFTAPAILMVASRMLGEEISKIDDTVKDLVGEITNMVTGGAKRDLGEKGYRFDMAIPTTITGVDHEISHKTHGPTVVVPFLIEGVGDFFVEVCFEDI
jgi:chemotaxis protein CheX